MGALRKLVAALACGLTLVGLSPPTYAAMPNQTVEVLKSKFHGAGSPGFLPQCSGTFALENYAYSSNTFTNTGATGWNPAYVGGSSNAPTLGSSTDTAPDGSSTAQDITVPAVPTGTSNYSILYSTSATSSTNFAPFNDWTYQIWVKDTSGAGTGNAFISVIATNSIATSPSVHANNLTNNTSTGAAFQAIYGTQYANGFASTPIPNDGQWRLVTVWVPAQFIASGYHQVLLSVGVDRRDTYSQTGSIVPSAAKTLVIWHAAFILGYSEGGKGWPDVQNNQTTPPSSTTNVTMSCPTGVAFRDFTQLKPWISSFQLLNGISQVTKQNQSEAYQYGGVGNPFWGAPSAYQLTGTYAGQYVGFTSTTDGTNTNSPSPNHDDWFDTIEYAGQDIWRTAEAQPGSPQIQIPGATVTAGGGLSPCPSSSSCSTAQTISNVSYAPSTGIVTLTMAATAPFTAGYSMAISGVTGAGTATINGAFIALSVSGATVTYQTNAGKTFAYTSGGSLSASAPMDSYALHAWWLPGGATVGGTPYQYAVMLSGKNDPNGNGGHSMFLAYSNTIDRLWCIYSIVGCANGSPTTPGGATTIQPTGVVSDVLYGGSANTSLSAPSLPTILQGGGFGGSSTVNYMVTPNQTATGGFVLWADAVGDGLTWTYVGMITGAGLSTDWDWNGVSADRIDPALYQNKCGPNGRGFLELYQTSFATNLFQGQTGTAKSQAIGYFIATDIRGPWYHFNGPGVAWKVLSGGALPPSGAIIKFDAALYNAQQFVGETNVWDQYGLFFWTGNTDDGHTFSSGVGGYMRDACQ